MNVWRALALVAVLLLGLGAAGAGYVRWRLAHVEVTERLTITTRSPGLPALEVERQLTEPMEDALSTIPGLRSMRSKSLMSVSSVTVEVTAVGADATSPEMLVHRATVELTRRLPPHADAPGVTRERDDDALQELLVVRSDRLSPAELTRWVSEPLREGLEAQLGVRALSRCGERHEQVTVTFDARRMAAYGLTEADAAESLIGRWGGDGAAPSVEAVQTVSFGRASVQDVATIQREASPPSCEAFLDGQPVLAVKVLRSQPGAVELPVVPPEVTVTRFTAKTRSLVAGDAMAAATLGGLVLARDGVIERYAAEAATSPQLISVNGGAVVVLSGADREQLVDVAEDVRAALRRAGATWVGIAWPTRQQPVRTVEREEIRRVELELGFQVGRLKDSTPLVVKLDGAADGARRVSERLEPGELLRVDRQRAVEVQAGLTAAAAREALGSIKWPSGVVARVR